MNIELLRHVYTTVTNAYGHHTPGFSFIIQSRWVRVTEHHLNKYLGLPTTDFDLDPEDYELVGLFYGILYTKENGDIPRKLYNNMLPMKCNLFFNILTHVFALKTCVFHSTVTMVQKIGYDVTNNPRNNVGKLIRANLEKSRL